MTARSQTLGEELDEIFAAPTPATDDVAGGNGHELATVSHVPGTCAIHGVELVTNRQLGIRTYGPDPAVNCPDPTHTDLDRARCQWCGTALVPPGTPRWQISPSKVFCTSADRLRSHRARKREATR